MPARRATAFMPTDRTPASAMRPSAAPTIRAIRRSPLAWRLGGEGTDASTTGPSRGIAVSVSAFTVRAAGEPVSGPGAVTSGRPGVPAGSRTPVRARADAQERRRTGAGVAATVPAG
ncbi:hypothetical protein ACVW0K_000762 [Streptomyces filamentosus]